MKRRLLGRGYLDRNELSKVILIADCGPALFEMDELIYECVDEFLNGKHRPPIIENLKRTVDLILDRLIDIA